MIEPKLRFKTDDGSQFPDWEEKTVGDMTVELQDYESLSSGYPLMTSSRTGLMMQNEFRSKSSTDDNTAIFSVVPRGVATYRHMSDDDIFHFNINNLVDKGLVSKEYPVFNTKDNYNLYLLVEYLNSSRNFLNFCKAQKKGGTRTRLYFNVLKDFELSMPSFPEQQKIAEFLSTIDTVIEKQKETVSAWEEKKLGDICKTFSGGTPKSGEERYYENGTISFIRSGEIHDDKTAMRITENGLNESSAKMIYIGDILYALYGATSGEVDISKINGAINQAILCIRPLTGFNRKFIVEVLRHNKENILRTYLQGGQGNLSAQIIQRLVFVFPCLPEQQKIADCLSSLDDVIVKQKATLSAWEELKKGLLQQMFV